MPLLSIVHMIYFCLYSGFPVYIIFLTKKWTRSHIFLMKKILDSLTLLTWHTLFQEGLPSTGPSVENEGILAFH